MNVVSHPFLVRLCATTHKTGVNGAEERAVPQLRSDEVQLNIHCSLRPEHRLKDYRLEGYCFKATGFQV